MKSASSYLFDLIKSLTNSEKRYFTLYARRHYPDHNNSLKLFQAIGNQLQYNEDEAIKKTGLNRNNFAVQKNLLYDQILTALVQYDAAGNIAQQLQQDIFACHRLLQKGLIAQAKTKLKKTKASATAYQMHEVSTQAMLIESMIQAREQYKQTTEKDLRGWYEEMRILTHKIETEAYLKYVNSRAQRTQLEAGGKSARHTAAVKALLDEAHERIDLTMTDRAQMDLLQTEALYYFMAQDIEKAQEINARFISLMESGQHWIHFYPQRYFSALNNYLIDCFQLKKENELKAGLDKMRLLKGHPAFKKTLNLEPNIFRITYQVELNYLISAGEFSKALDILPAVMEGLNNYADAIPIHHRMNMQYLTAYALFGAGRYEDASSQLDKLQQYSRNDTATFIDDVASIMQVVCHYEMKNYSILDSLIKSCKRKLDMHKNSKPAGLEFDVLNAILSFCAKEPEAKDWMKLWDKICRKSHDQKPHSPHNDYFDLFNYVYAKSRKIKYENVWQQLNRH